MKISSFQLTELAAKQGLDLEAKAGDFKKFRKGNKAVCSSYFKLLDDKRTGLDDKQKRKKEKKKEAAAKPSSMGTNGVNKKIKFEEDEETKVGVKEKENKEPFDVDKTINKIDKKLKKKNLKRKIKEEC